MYLTDGPNADKFLSSRARKAKMGLRAAKANDGPVFRTLKEIAALPLEQRLDAFVDRLDLLDRDEQAKIAMNHAGDEYSTTSNAVRLKILDVGKQWLHDAEKQGVGAGKLAALKVFDSPRKAG